MGSIDDELKIKEIGKKVEEDYIKAASILKEYFKDLYENAGMEWSEENNKDIDFIVEAMVRKAASIAIIRSGDLLLKALSPKKEIEK